MAPTAAEYRLLGANEPLARRDPGRDGRLARSRRRPAAWVHDLRTTSRFTDLWPWLLVLALLLWPLDIALRRVSLGRRELADGRRWVSDRVRGRRVAARTQARRGDAGRPGPRRVRGRAHGDPARGRRPGRGLRRRPRGIAGRRRATPASAPERATRRLAAARRAATPAPPSAPARPPAPPAASTTAGVGPLASSVAGSATGLVRRVRRHPGAAARRQAPQPLLTRPGRRRRRPVLASRPWHPSPPAGRRSRAVACRSSAAVLASCSACGTISTTPPPPPRPTSRASPAASTWPGSGADWVSGDPGCADAGARAARRSGFEAPGLDQAEPVTLYLYIFRNRDGVRAQPREAVGPCAAAFVTDAETYEQIEQSPYVIASQGPWAPEFEAALRKTLEAAAGTGG